MKKTDWCSVRIALDDALFNLDPRDSAQVAFFFLKVFELKEWIDVNIDPKPEKNA